MLFVGHCVWVGEFIAVSNCPCKKIKLLQKYLVISLIFLLLYDRIEMWCFCWVNHISCFCCCKLISSGNNRKHYQDYTGRLSKNCSNSTCYLYTDGSCKRYFITKKLHRNIFVPWYMWVYQANLYWNTSLNILKLLWQINEINLHKFMKVEQFRCLQVFLMTASSSVCSI